MIGLGLAATLATAAVAGAGQAPPDSTPGDGLTVYLLTFDPGPLLWERFGHNALWIRDRTAGTDWGYDYGRFTFGQTTGDLLRFVGRFIKGDLKYSMGDGPVQRYLDGYTAAGRAIWAQELDLPPAARVVLRDFLNWNRREENKYYQYHYYLDNCSTRIRDAIDRVVGGQVKAWADTLRTAATYRDHTKRTTESDPLMYTLLDIGLGQPTDHRVTAWEEMFLPISLRPYLDSISVRDPDGRVHRLVKEERHLVESERFRVADGPPNWLGRYLLLGLGLGGVMAGLGRLARGSTRWRYLFAGVAGLWSLVVGLGGAVLLGLWAFTPHHFAAWNENLFQLNVASLVVAGAFPRGAFRRSSKVLEVAVAAVAATAALGLLLKVLPGFNQSNLDIIAMMLPGHLGLWAGWRASR